MHQRTYGTHAKPFLNDCFRNSWQASAKIRIVTLFTPPTVLGLRQLICRHVMLISGHRNKASVRSYSRDCSVHHKKVISDTLQAVVDGEQHDALPEPAIPTFPWCPQPSGSVVGVGPLVRVPVYQQPSLPNMSIFPFDIIPVSHAGYFRQWHI